MRDEPSVMNSPYSASKKPINSSGGDRNDDSRNDDSDDECSSTTGTQNIRNSSVDSWFSRYACCRP